MRLGISAAIISIGLCYMEKEEVNKRCNEFYKKFIEKYKNTCCRGLTKQWKDNFAISERKNFCAKIIQEMIIELEKILK
ncbi:MAG: C-GCAxxG-C-C family protein [bacterium]